MQLTRIRRSVIYFTSGRILHVVNIIKVNRLDNMLELITTEDVSHVINLNNVEHYIVKCEEGESKDDKTE